MCQCIIASLYKLALRIPESGYKAGSRSASESKFRSCGSSEWRCGGSVDQWLQIGITLMRIRIPDPRITVKVDQDPHQSEKVGFGLDPYSIGSVDPDPYSESGSGSRRARMTHKSRKKLVKIHVLKCWMASFES
jgi:hypothetical protein